MQLSSGAALAIYEWCLLNTEWQGTGRGMLFIYHRNPVIPRNQSLRRNIYVGT